MADRQWFASGVQIFETGEEEYFVGGTQINEDQASAPASGRIMGSLVGQGGLIGPNGGIIGQGGGIVA